MTHKAVSGSRHASLPTCCSECKTDMVLTANVQLVVVAVVVVSVFGTSKIPCTKETVNECLKPMLKDTGNDTGSPNCTDTD
ncbi:hypothetical protein LSAT2_026069 [Lamellibrachia satsuma]|nr:hypothetical protein LSAT2_026069 [Lamellibrachia satsuma]